MNGSIRIMLLFAATFSLWAQDQAMLQFDTPHGSFGEIYQGATISHRFKFTNFGKKPVTIKAVHVGTSRGSGYAVPEMVPPGGNGEIYVEVADNVYLGKSSLRISVDTDDPAMARYRLRLSGFALSAFDPEALRLDFGFATLGIDQVLEKEIFCREVPRLEVLGWDDAPGLVKVEVSERIGVADEGVKLKFTLRTKVLAGHVAGSFRLKTNVPQQPDMLIHFTGKIYGDVAPQESPVDLGLIRVGETKEHTLMLTSRSGTPFQIDRVVDPQNQLSLSHTAMADNPAQIALRLVKLGTQKERYEGELLVYVQGRETPVPIAYSGMVTTANARITKLRPEQEDAQ